MKNEKNKMNLSDYFPIIKEKNDKCNNYLIETNPHNILNEFENNKKLLFFYVERCNLVKLEI